MSGECCPLPKRVQKECKHHGWTEFVFDTVEYRCIRCRNERVIRYRKRSKVILVAAFGGKCCICGYDKYTGALEFHHLDPTEKRFGIARKGCTVKIDTLAAEAKKCVLLCANCHREVEGGVTALPDNLPAPNLPASKPKKPKHIPDPEWRTRPKLKLRKVERPPVEVVREEVRQLGYCAVGRKYGVTDNAIRKWLKCPVN